MNIFILDQDFDVCARYHVDKHVIKMLTEYCQILSTAHRILDGEKVIGTSKSGRKQVQWRMSDAVREITFHKATHVNHPSTVWARQSIENYAWLYDLLVALSKEYTHRYGKIYKAFRTDLALFLSKPPENIPIKGFTPFALAMPDEYKTSDAVESYRNYYMNGKKHLHSWKKRNVPYWM